MPGQHALLSASSAKRWMSCPPSARLEEKLRERFGEGETEFAREGTRAHSLAELKLRKENGEINDYNYKLQRAAMGEIPNEMDNATDYYCDIVMQKLYAARKSCPDAKLLIEQRLDFSRYVPHGFGTGDAVVVSDLCLDVSDLKYGKGVPVSALENPQARLYGTGATLSFGSLYDFPTVRNTIIQPRLDSVTEEVLSREELLRWAEDEAAPKARLAWEGQGEFCTGDWCRFCAARAICWHRMSRVLSMLTDTGMAGVVPDDQIPGILAVADEAEAWIKDLKDYAKNQAISGLRWPGWKLVYGKRPARKWASEDEARQQLLLAGYPTEKIEQTKLLGIAELEKMMGVSAFRAILGPYVTQANGSPTLVPETDGRAEISSALEQFNDLEGETTNG